MADEEETTAFELVEEKKGEKDEEEEDDEDAPAYGDPLQTPPPTPARPTSAGGESTSRYSRIKARVLDLLPESLSDRLEDLLDDLETSADPADRRRRFFFIGVAVLAFLLLLLFITFITLALISSSGGEGGSAYTPLQSMDLILRESFDPQKASSAFSSATSNQSSTSSPSPSSPSSSALPQSLPDLYKLAIKSEDPVHQAAFVRELTRSIWRVTLAHLQTQSSSSSNEETLQRTALLAGALPTLASLDLKEELAVAEGWLRASCGVSQFWDGLEPKWPDSLEDYLQVVLACYGATGNQTALTKAKELFSKDLESGVHPFSTDLRVRIPSLQQATLKAFEARPLADLIADFVKYCYRGPPPQNETSLKNASLSSQSLPPLAFLRVLVPLHLQSKLPWNLVTKYQSLISSIISRKLWTDINQDNAFDFARSCAGELKFEMASADCDLGGLLGLAWAASPANFPEIGGGERVLEAARGVAGGCELVSAKGNGLTAKVFEMTSSGRWIGMGRGSGVRYLELKLLLLKFLKF